MNLMRLDNDKTRRNTGSDPVFGAGIPDEQPRPNHSSQHRGVKSIPLAARGEPFLWTMGGALVIGILMILAFLMLILYNGIIAFYPKPIHVVEKIDGSRIAGEPTRREIFRVQPHILETLGAAAKQQVENNQGLARRTLYKTGNFDLYNEDFKWIDQYEIQRTATTPDIFYIERTEWGPFIGFITAIFIDGEETPFSLDSDDVYQTLKNEHKRAVSRRNRIRHIERNEIGAVNHHLEKGRLKLRRIALRHGTESDAYEEAQLTFTSQKKALTSVYDRHYAAAEKIKADDARHKLLLSDINGRETTIKISDIIRFYPANALGTMSKLRIYLSRWWEFLTAQPREANTEGGVMPAIFGTFVMTLFMVLAVTPFGVMAALYLREYARQGRMVSLVRICVNNLAGVPSIVYGVFGLGFFAYIVGGTIDAVWFPERLPTPTFGTGGLLWASLTLALLTVPVVIVATEEALAAVPSSLREGSLACGASKWQTIRHIVLPKAMPGIMTGLILAMARGAGEVAPLMLVGVVKLAPELPVDGFFPFIHLERSFMHLGFHIFDVGFQSRNAEAGKPMVFVTTLLLISFVALMNATAIYIRSRLKRKYQSGHF